KIILVTGNVNNEQIQSVEKHLCYILAKPFHPEVVIDLLTSLCACEKSCKNNPTLNNFKDCKLAIDQNCPFH
ncbi:MAG: hypothetical protein Q9M21_05920, partial [Mariprofundaceae bacterium]|nr:hypothetical protein [Mariprofundaceae bacterium]